MEINIDIVDRIHHFTIDEARYCSMDFGCVTPLYVYRMWGRAIPLCEIETALTEIKKRNLIY
jgi:hypothetical protein